MTLPRRIISSVGPAGDWVELGGALLFNRKTQATVELGPNADQVDWSPSGDRVTWAVKLDPDNEISTTDVYWLDLSTYTGGDSKPAGG